jgi:hypothetical protein
VSSKTGIFVAAWPGGEITRMSIHSHDIERAVRVSWAAYSHRLRLNDAAFQHAIIRSGYFTDNPTELFTDLNVSDYLARPRRAPCCAFCRGGAALMKVISKNDHARYVDGRR